MINTNNAGKSFHQECPRSNGRCLASEAQVDWERTIPCPGYAGNQGFKEIDTDSSSCGTVSKISNGQEKLYVRKAVNCNDTVSRRLLNHEREANEDLATEIYNTSKAPLRTQHTSFAPSAYKKTSIANFIPMLGYGHNAQNNRDYIDFAEGPQSLRKAIENKAFIGKKSSMSAAVNLADALFFLGNAGYVHSDLKLENILFDPATNLLKLIDMGLAFAFRDQNKKQKSIKLNIHAFPQIYCGSPEAYLLHGRDAELAAITNPKMDVYAFGLMLPEILFGSATYQLVHCEFLGQNSLAATQFRTEGKFYENIARIVNFGQSSLPRNQQYSKTQILGFTNIIKWCLNPNPLLRPTFAQIGLYLEALATNLDGAEELSLEEIRKIAFDEPISGQLASPNADGSLTPEAIGVYSKYQQIWTFAYDHPWTHIDTSANMPMPYYLSGDVTNRHGLVKFTKRNMNFFPEYKFYSSPKENFNQFASKYKMPTQSHLLPNNNNQGNNQPQFFPPQFPPANNINYGNNQQYFPPVPFPVPPAPAKNINYGNNQRYFPPVHFPVPPVPANNNNQGNNQQYFPPVHFPVPPVPANNIGNNNGNNNNQQPNAPQNDSVNASEFLRILQNVDNNQQHQNPQNPYQQQQYFTPDNNNNNNNNQGNNQPNPYLPNPYLQYQNQQRRQQNLISSPSLVVNNNQPNPYLQNSYPVLPPIDLKQKNRRKREENYSSSDSDSSSEEISAKKKRKKEKSKKKAKSDLLKKKKRQKEINKAKKEMEARNNSNNNNVHNDEFSYSTNSDWVKEMQLIQKKTYLKKIIHDINSLPDDVREIFGQLESKKKGVFANFVGNKYHDANSYDFMGLSDEEKMDAISMLHLNSEAEFFNYVAGIYNKKISK
jgi:serine/threonine protein kinase